MINEIDWTLLIPGVVIALFGWTLYWTGVHVIGAFVGAGAGSVGGIVIGALMFPSSPMLLATCLGAAVGAVLGVILMRAIQIYFFFLVGASFGAPLGWSLLQLSPFENQAWAHSLGVELGAVALGGLAGGFLVLRSRRYIVALVAAAVGSTFIALSLPWDMSVLIAVPCFLTSMAIQTGLIRKFLSKERIDRAMVMEERRRADQEGDN
ncbi:hypothetical protein IIC65_07550 [Candidatus Sumerlaeota bacterium]|nr:hypothetical protein [Candidatus Sumerlaeota bacterium]